MAGGWDSLGLHPDLVGTASEEYGWTLPTDVQDECIPLVLGGGDVMASAETGSGKTAAFALPVVQLCCETKGQEEDATGSSKVAKQQQQSSSSTTAIFDKDNPPFNTTTESSSEEERQQQQSTTATEWRMSALDRDRSVAIEPSSRGLRVQSRDPNNFAGCRATHGIDIGRMIATNNSSSSGSSTTQQQTSLSYTCRPTAVDDGFVRLGWSTADASLDLGTDPEGWGYGSTGVLVHNKSFTSYGGSGAAAVGGVRGPFGRGDVIGCHLRVIIPAIPEEDPDDDASRQQENKKNKKKNNPVVAVISYTKNGNPLGDAFEIRKRQASVAGSGGGSSSTSAMTLFPAVCLKNSECVLQFSSSSSSANNDDEDEGRSDPTLLPSSLPSEGHYRWLSPAPDEIKDAIVNNPRDSSISTTANKRGPLAICIEPTRDLAEQTFRVFDDLSTRISDPPAVHAALLVGGINPGNTVKQLEANKVDILVGTPPIVASYMKRGTIGATRCRYFVLDEADELIGSDSIKNIKSIYGRILAANENICRFDRLQVCFFSATLESREVRELAESICHRPLWIKLRGTMPDTVHHCFIQIDPKEFNKEDEHHELIKTDAVHRGGKLDKSVSLEGLDDNEANSEKVKQLKMHAVLDVLEKFSMDQVLIFLRTNLDCDLMEKYLKRQSSSSGTSMVDKYSCRVLAGMRSMQERKKSLEDFKSGEVRILLCTDVAARGIDIRELPFVINFTLPDSAQTYAHRVGRCGRAARMGLAVSLVATVEERVWFCRSGKKPPCTDTRDYKKGGNCIWYDEPDLLKGVEGLLRQANVQATELYYLPKKLNIPPLIKSLVEGGRYGDYTGESTHIDPEMELAMKRLQDQVKIVQDTESDLQSDYWSIRRIVP